MAFLQEGPDPNTRNDKEGPQDASNSASVLVENPVCGKGSDGMENGKNEGISGDDLLRVIEGSLYWGVDAGKGVDWEWVDEGCDDVDDEVDKSVGDFLVLGHVIYLLLTCFIKIVFY